MSDTSSDFKKLEAEDPSVEDERPFASWLPPLLSTEPTPGVPPATLTGLGPLSTPRAAQAPEQSAPRATNGSPSALATEQAAPSNDDEYIEPSDEDDDDEPTRVISQMFPPVHPRRRSAPSAAPEADAGVATHAGPAEEERPPSVPARDSQPPAPARESKPAVPRRSESGAITAAATEQSELLAQMVESLARRRQSAPRRSSSAKGAPLVEPPRPASVPSAPSVSRGDDAAPPEIAPEQVQLFEAAVATLAPPAIQYVTAEPPPVIERATPAASGPAQSVPSPGGDAAELNSHATDDSGANDWNETTRTHGAPPPPKYPPSIQLSPAIERELPTAPASRKPTPPPSDPISARVTPIRSEPPWAATVGPKVPSKSKPGLRIALGAFAASALLTVLALRAFMPGKGTVLVTAVGAHGTPVEQGQVFLDGKLACEPVPCRVGKVREGRHLVTVKAPGYQSVTEKAVVVDSDSEGLVHFALTPENTAGLHVRVAARGMRVFLDGEDRGEAPLTLGGLSPAEHTLRLAGSSAYSPYEQKIRLKPNETLTLTPELVPLQAFITLEPGAGANAATVEVLGGPERKAIVELPARIEVPLGGTYRVRATRSGFEPFETEVRFGEGEADKRVRVELRPAVVAAAQPAPETQPASIPARALPVVLEEAPAAAAKPRPNPAAVAPVPGTAITLSSEPPSSVIVNGRPVGATPQRVPVAAGSHSVVFVHPTLGRKSMTVKVEPGKTASASARF